MDSLLYYVGMVGMLAGLITNRALSERATRLLSAEEKLILLDNFSRLRAFGAVPLALIALIFLAIGRLPVTIFLPCYFTTWALLGTFVTWQSIYVHRRLRELDISESYRSALTRAQWYSKAGFLLIFVCITQDLFH
jgi:hypothetical protein